MLKWPVAGAPVFSDKSTQEHEVGQRAEDRFGRQYRYVKAGAVDLVVGNALQSPAEVPNHQALTPSAAAIGDNEIVVTLGATAATADQYKGGVAVIDTTPGVGYSYPIRTHPAADASASLTVKLAPGWEVVIALTATSRVTLALNPYSGVIQCPVTTATGTAAGVCVHIITASQFGWIGTHGAFSTLIDGTITLVGTLVTHVASVAGSVAVHSGVLPIVGHLMRDGVDTKNNPVFWTID